MKELIKITETNGKKAVSARELYQFLSIDDGSHFAEWGRRNIEEIFIENVDYQSLRYVGENGGRPGIDYALSIDCAKQFKTLRDKNILRTNNTPYQTYIDQGYFVVKITPNLMMGNYAQTYVTGKGLTWLSKMFNVKKTA